MNCIKSKVLLSLPVSFVRTGFLFRYSSANVNKQICRLSWVLAKFRWVLEKKSLSFKKICWVLLKVRWVFEKTVEFYQMLLRVVSKLCFEFQQIILEYLHSVARNAKSFLFNLCDRNALSYHKSGYFRTITVLMHPFLQNWIDTKFAGYIEFFDKILEFLEKSLSFRDFLEFFRPWVFRFQRKRKPDLKV